MKLFWLVFLSIHFVYSLGQLPSQDILTLLEFKKGIKHDPTGYVVQSWNDESIDFNGCPSSWNGIVCSGENIAGVVLNGLGLVGDVDLSVFSNLTMLAKLSLANNSITGKIPSSVGEDFRNLEYLDLSNNMFFSSVPVEIGKLGNLKNLSLAGNNFSGPIPDSISGLNSIQSLDLSHNSFSGSIPSSLRRLPNLVFLNLSLNGFTDEIPKGLELMTNLQVIDLHGNNLSGNLDLDLLLLTSAVHVDFSNNLLVSSGSNNPRFLPAISDTITHLDLSHNRLTGSLVGSEVRIFGNLKFLDLSYNQLSGDLPGFSFAYDLQALKLSNNRFSGFVPDGLLKGDSLVLAELDLSGNSLSGSMGMITSTTLRVLNLSSNSLSGDLPLLIGSCTILDLSNNQLGGNLTRLSKWANVEILDLSRNRLTGTIPEVTSQFLRLNYLNLSGNYLDGSLPGAVARFPKLTVLDLSFNRLNGSVITELLSSSTLQEIHLQNNLLVGEINISTPYSSSQSVLQVLDLSHNQLDGQFSDGFGSLSGLKTLNLAENNLTGSLPSSMEEMASIVSLIISGNRFTGPLPNNLSSSLVSFNASYNDLSGVVPENLRRFPLSAFFPGNSKLIFPNPPESGHGPSNKPKGKPIKHIVKVIVLVACVVFVVILLLLSVLVHYIRISKKSHGQGLPVKAKQKGNQSTPSGFTGRDDGGGGIIVSAEDLRSSRKGTSSEIISQSEKMVPIAGFSPSKNSQFSWSSESGDSYIAENLSRLDVRSPDRLVGELYFLDDTISITPEELSRAPAEVLGRSSHGTSYKATLDNGILLTVKWLREGVAKPRKDFAKEAKKFANIRHPNVVGLRGYYWGPTQHEKLILSDYISPGSLANFLYDRPGRRGPALTWAQRLKIAVDVSRGLNYLHFDRAMPHGNIKATNILLEGSDLNARVADYCLHRLMTQTGTMEQILDAGVLGYRAPELASSSSSKKPVPSFKSDVYAFGVILLELLTGKCAGDVVSGEDAGGVDLTDWVRLKVAEGQDCFDSTMPEMGNPAAQKGMKAALGIALRCIRPVSERVGIKSIYEDLSSI